MTWLPPDVLSRDPEALAERLATELRDGTLVLFLGAGVSAGMGLPNWWQLVRDCQVAAGAPGEPVDENTSNEALRKAVDKIRSHLRSTPGAATEQAFHNLVRVCLYHQMKSTDSLLGQRLLLSVGALLVNSRRGHIQNVVTFNFDDLLERYLAVLGFTTQMVGNPFTLIRDVDVNIFHPHGFLPAGGDGQSDFPPVFGALSYYKAMAGLDGWVKHNSNLLTEKIGLFVGLSTADPIFGPMLAGVNAVIENAQPGRPTGIWLLGPKDDVDAEAELMAQNIVPIRFGGYDGYSSFLLDVCAKAAQR